MRRLVTAAVLAFGALAPGAAAADPSQETVEQLRQPAAVDPAAESHYQRGVRARAGQDWAGAERAFREAIVQEPTLAAAWNELGYALRHLRRYAESVNAYHEALRLRPDFPEALEYLGEAYVDLGQLEDARQVLGRLRPLDAGRAQELEEAIAKAR